MQHLKLRIAPLLALLLILAACTDDTLKKIATAVNGVADSVEVVQTTVVQAHEAKLLSDQSSVAIMQVCLRVTQANTQASALTRKFTQLPAADRAKLVTILDPVIQAVKDSITSDAVIKIQDPGVKNKVVAALTVVQTGLAVARGLL